MDKEHLTFIDEDGNEVLCEILFTFDSEMFNKSYVLFYPVSDVENDDDEDSLDIMAASYVPGKETEGELFPIETDEEWELIENVLKQYEEDNYNDDYGELDDEYDLNADLEDE